MGGLWGKGDSGLIIFGLLVFPFAIWFLFTSGNADPLQFPLPGFVHYICSSLLAKVLLCMATLMMFFSLFRLAYVIAARRQELASLQALLEAAKANGGCNSVVVPAGNGRPMISIIMPVKFDCLKSSNPAEMWHAQFYTKYEGRVEYLFVVESAEDKVVEMIEAVRATKTNLSLRIVIAGKTVTTSQKIHNMLAGVNASSPESKYLYFVDAACETHPNTFGDNVDVLETNPDVYVCSGFPVDIPPAGSTLWTWALCQFRWTSSLASFNSNRFKGVWGGCICIRRSAFMPPNKVWSETSYGDDVEIQGVAEDGAGAIATPMSNLFPNIMKKDISMQTGFQFLRRQAKMLRSYQTPGMMCRNTVLSLFGLLTSFGLSSSVPFGPLALLCTIAYPDTFRAYPVMVALSAFWCLLTVIHAWMEKQMLLSAIAICQIQAPTKLIETRHLSIGLFAVSLWAQTALSTVAYVMSYVYPYITWGGIVYTLHGGKVSSVAHPEAARAPEDKLTDDLDAETEMPGTPGRNRLLVLLQVVCALMVLMAFNADRARPLPETPTYASSWPVFDPANMGEARQMVEEEESVIPFVYDGTSRQKKECVVVGGVPRSVEVPEVHKTVTIENRQVFEIPVPIQPGTKVLWSWQVEGEANEKPVFSVLMYDSEKKAVLHVPVDGSTEGNFTGTKDQKGVLSLSWKNKGGITADGGDAGPIQVTYTVKLLQETQPLSAAEQLASIPIVVLTLPQSVRRQATVTQRMEEYNLKFEFEEGVDGDQLEKLAPGTWKLQDRDITILVPEKKIPNGVKSKLSPLLSTHEVAVTVSHLKAIRHAYLSKVEYAMIAEDDISLEYLPRWHDKGLDPVMEALECGSEMHRSWSVVQMAITVGFLKSSLGRKLEERLYTGESVTLRDPVKDYELWSATAYLVHRRGMEFLLDKHWPGGLKEIEKPWEEVKGTFDFRNSLSGLADAVVYSAPNTFVVNRPLFSSDDDGVSSLHTRDDSFVFNFNPDRKSKRFVTEKFYPKQERERTFHGDRLASCQMDLGFLPSILPRLICESYLWLRSAVELLIVLLLLIPGRVRVLAQFCKTHLQQCFTHAALRCRQGCVQKAFKKHH